MVWLVILGSLLGIAWVGSVAYLALEQRRFIFRPTLRETDPVKAGAEWMSAIHDDHGQLLGWWFPPPNPTAPTLVFFHGNQGYLARVAEKTATWRNLGIGVFGIWITF